MGLILDTTFLIDLERATIGKSKDNSVFSFLDQNKNTELFISVITLGEFSEGIDKKDIFESYLNRFQVMPIDREVAWIYGQITSELRKKGNLIGANDLWISATAIRNNMPIVTRNVSDFSRVKDLKKVIEY